MFSIRRMRRSTYFTRVLPPGARDPHVICDVFYKTDANFIEFYVLLGRGRQGAAADGRGPIATGQGAEMRILRRFGDKGVPGQRNLRGFGYPGSPEQRNLRGFGHTGSPEQRNLQGLGYTGSPEQPNLRGFAHAGSPEQRNLRGSLSHSIRRMRRSP